MKEVVFVKLKVGYGTLASFVASFCVSVLFSDFFTEPGSAFLVALLLGFVLGAGVSHLEWYWAYTNKHEGGSDADRNF